MNNEERWNVFINELKAYIDVHHHLPDKHKVEHRGLLNQVKYIRKKIKEGKIDEAKVCEFNSVMGLRTNEHTGGRRKKDNYR